MAEQLKVVEKLCSMEYGADRNIIANDANTKFVVKKIELTGSSMPSVPTNEYLKRNTKTLVAFTGATIINNDATVEANTSIILDNNESLSVAFSDDVYVKLKNINIMRHDSARNIRCTKSYNYFPDSKTYLPYSFSTLYDNPSDTYLLYNSPKEQVVLNNKHYMYYKADSSSTALKRVNLTAGVADNITLPLAILDFTFNSDYTKMYATTDTYNIVCFDVAADGITFTVNSTFGTYVMPYVPSTKSAAISYLQISYVKCTTYEGVVYLSGSTTTSDYQNCRVASVVNDDISLDKSIGSVQQTTGQYSTFQKHFKSDGTISVVFRTFNTYPQVYKFDTIVNITSSSTFFSASAGFDSSSTIFGHSFNYSADPKWTTLVILDHANEIFAMSYNEYSNSDSAYWLVFSGNLTRAYTSYSTYLGRIDSSNIVNNYGLLSSLPVPIPPKAGISTAITYPTIGGIIARVEGVEVTNA